MCCWPIVHIFFELTLGFFRFHANTSEKLFEWILTFDLQSPKFILIENEKEIFPPGKCFNIKNSCS